MNSDNIFLATNSQLNHKKLLFFKLELLHSLKTEFNRISSLTYILFLKNFFFLVCPIWLPVFFLFFYNEPELGAEINPGMAVAPFPSSILDETRFEPTTFQS